MKASRTFASFMLAATLGLAAAAPSVADDTKVGGVVIAIEDDGLESADGTVDPAGASNCRWERGPLWASLCFQVKGSGTYVDGLYLMYNAAANICDQEFQFRYTPQLAPRKTVTRKKSGCVAGQSWYALTLEHYLHDGHYACGRVRNNQTGGVWTDWYCHMVKR